jgi:hypothetical protein
MVFKVALATAIRAGFQRLAPAPSAAPSALILALALACGATERAEALPAFARQTGQTCSTCHTAFLQLTPFGRRFKLNGYISRGGGPDGDSGTRDALLTPPLPLAFMWQSTFTHLNRGLDEPAGNPYAPPSPNGGFPGQNNFVDGAQQMSIYYGGQIYGNLGAFVQFSYSNDYARAFGMDNSDVRYTGQFTLYDTDVLWGVTANNRPTMQDVWNTSPVWAYPFLTSSFGPSPAAATMIESFGPVQALGAGAYVFVNNTYYAELSAYGSPSPTVQTTMGESPPSLGYTISGLAPYYRIAAEPVWGEHALMIGAYGMAANIIPNRVFGFGTDKVTDLGFDSQYQWLTDEHAVTLRANYIFERQILDASSNPLNVNCSGMTAGVGNGPCAANPVNYLRSLNISAEYVYDHKYAFEVAYFQYTGSPDSITFANNLNFSPNSNGWVFDVSYLPFMRGGPSFWPWLNTRVGASYTLYNRFNGGTTNIDPVNCPGCRNAHDNNTLMVYSWTMW